MGLPAVVVMKNPNERLAFSVSVRRGEQRWAGHASAIAILTKAATPTLVDCRKVSRRGKWQFFRARFYRSTKIRFSLMHILDEIIDKMVRQIFSRLRGIPKEQLITSRYAKETAERKNHLQALQAERDKAEKDLLALKTEILAVIKGESAFPKDTLAEMIAAQEKKHTELDTLCEEASAELERNAELMANVSQLYEELISYADLYDSASFEAKKMIVSQLIRRVEVYRGYQIHVDFNFDLAQYLENSDELAC